MCMGRQPFAHRTPETRAPWVFMLRGLSPTNQKLPACMRVRVCLCLSPCSVGLLFRPFLDTRPLQACGWTWQPGPQGRDSLSSGPLVMRRRPLLLPPPHPSSCPRQSGTPPTCFGKKLLRNLLPKKNFQPVSKYLVVHNSVLQKPCYTLSLFLYLEDKTQEQRSDSGGRLWRWSEGGVGSSGGQDRPGPKGKVPPQVQLWAAPEPCSQSPAP